MPDSDITILDYCTPRQLRELIAMAAIDSTATRNLLLEIGDAEQLESLLNEMCSGTGESGGGLMRAVCSPETTVETLTAIKSIAKRMAVAGRLPVQNAAATLLYHLAVASALGHHQCNISAKDPAERLSLYKELAGELPDDELAAVFEKAVAGLPPAKP